MYRMATRTQDNAWETWSRYYYEWREKGLRCTMIHLEPEVCFFFLSLFIYYINDYLKAAKPMDGNNMEENEKREAWDMLQHISSPRYVIYINFF